MAKRTLNNRVKPTTEEKQAAFDLQNWQPNEGDAPIRFGESLGSLGVSASITDTASYEWIDSSELLGAPFFINDAAEMKGKFGKIVYFLVSLVTPGGDKAQFTLAKNDDRTNILQAIIKRKAENNGQLVNLGPLTMVELPTTQGNDYKKIIDMQREDYMAFVNKPKRGRKAEPTPTPAAKKASKKATTKTAPADDDDPV